MKPASFLLILFSALIFSCGKYKNDSPQDPQAGYIEFKVNDTLHKVQLEHNSYNGPLRCDQDLTGTIAQDDSSRYTILASDPTGQEYSLALSLVTDSLAAGDYVIDSGDVAHYQYYYVVPDYQTNHYSAEVHYAGDYMKVHISSNTGRLISGTFSAKFSSDAGFHFDAGKSGQLLITDGKFTNVKVW